MIATLLAGLESFFRWLLEASWQASVLAALVLLLQATLRGKLNPRWRHALWLLVVARLILPVLPESALSLFRFAPPPPPVITSVLTEPIFPIPSVLPSSTPLPVTAPPPQLLPPSHPLSAFTLLALTWLVGALAFFGVTWLVNHRFTRHVTATPRVTDPRLLALANAAQQELGIHRAVKIIESTQVQGPAIMGLLRPTLVLPMDARARFTSDELRFIFLHEFAHLKRGDLILQWLVALLQIFHWFNPVLWYAFRRMRIDREPATDALVLSRTGEAQKESYAQVLVKLLEHHHARHALPALVGILEDKDQFKRRFLLITKFTNGAYGWSLLGVALIGVLTVSCLTNGKASNDSPASPTTTMTPAEAKAKGIVALVNGKPVYWWLVANARPYLDTPENRPFAVQEGIDNELKMQACSSSKEATSHADEEVKKKLDYDIEGFHGDKEAFVANLKKNGLTLDQYTELLRYEEIVSYFENTETIQPAMDYVDQHLPHTTAPDNKKERQKLFNAQTTLLMNQWRQKLRSKAMIQVFEVLPATTSSDNSTTTHPLPATPASTDLAKQLVAAVKKSDLAEIQKLLDAGADPNSNPPPDGQSALFDAAIANQFDVVKLLLQHGGAPNKTNTCGNHPLIWVLEQGHLEMAEVLKGAGAKISPAAWAGAKGDLTALKDLAASGQLKSGKTDEAMKNAVSCGQMEAVKFLEGIDGKPVAGKFLVQAAQSGNIPMLEYILKQGADIKTDGGKAIDQAVIFFNQTEAVKFLLAHGVDPNRTTGWNESLICSAKNAAMVKVLLDAGANPNSDIASGSPLAQAPDRESVRLLVQHGANIKVRDKNGLTLIECLLQSKSYIDRPDVMDELIKEGAEFDPKGNGVDALAGIAFFPEQTGTVQVLLDRGVDPNAYSDAQYHHESALASAAFQAPEVVRLLLARGANPNGDPRDAFSPLATAIMTVQWEAGEMLRKAGAHDVGELSIAAAKGDLTRVDQLLKGGDDVNQTDRIGETPLFFAVRRGHPDVARFLLEHGANINLFDASGMTPKSNFDLMAGSGNPDQVQMDWGVSADDGKRTIAELKELFTKFRADPNYQNAQGRTALHQMAWAGASLVELALGDKAHPADVNLRDHDGNTSLLLAALSPRAKETFTSLSIPDSSNPKAPMKEWNASAFIADQLINAGAKLDLKMSDGKTVGEAALAAAEKVANPQLISVLRDAMNGKKTTLTPPATSPNDPSTQPKDIAAMVNDHPITKAELEEAWRSAEDNLRANYHGDALQKQLTEMRKKVLDAVIDRQLMMDDYTAQGHFVPKSFVDEQIREVVRDNYSGDRNQFLATLAHRGVTEEKYRKDIESNRTVGFMWNENVESKVSQYYQDHLDQFPQDEQVNVTVVQIKGSKPVSPGQLDDFAHDTDPRAELARNVLAQMRASLDAPKFEQTEGVDASHSGKPQWVTQKNPFSEVPAYWPFKWEDIAKLQPGQASEVRIGDGTYAYKDGSAQNYHFYWILRVNARRPATAKETDATAAKSRALQKSLREQTQHEWIASLRAKAKIQTFDVALTQDPWATDPVRAVPVNEPAVTY